jgi:Replicase family/Primase C terminal 1 (PriCT-1)
MTLTAERWQERYRQTWPSATDDLSKGNYRQPRELALQRRYIQANPSALITSLVVDIDEDDALLRALDLTNGVPTPSYVAQSPTGKAHAAYLLKAPVCRTDNARLEPMRFAARVEAGLVNALGGDRGYAGFLTKNPVHEHWDTFWGTDRLYTLKELADHLPGWLPRSLPRKAADNSGLGRNVALFNRVRLWSYSGVRRYWSDGPTVWGEVTEAYALSVNQEFAVPLEASEVGHLARSVSRWTWRNFTPERFTEIQTERGRKGSAVAAAKRTIDRGSMLEVLSHGR